MEEIDKFVDETLEGSDEMLESVRAEIMNFDEFLEESDEMLKSVRDDLMDFGEKQDREVVNRICRAFHSVKGNAAMVGFDRLGEIAHGAESVVSLIRNGELDVGKATVDALLHALDMMKFILDEIREGGDAAKVPAVGVDFLEDIVASARQAKEPADADGGGEMELTEEPVETSVEAPANLTESCPNPPVHAVTGIQRSAGSPLKILIVEDDFTSRTILMNFFSGYGECHIAKDGLEAIQAFTGSYEQEPPQPYDLICMDIMMPRMDGIQATRTIREIERGKGVEGTEYETAIIVASTLNDPATIIKTCYECGANYYFVKPLDFKQMKRQLRKLNLIP